MDRHRHHDVMGHTFGAGRPRHLRLKAGFTALAALALWGVSLVNQTTLTAQAAADQIPTFELDPTWPKPLPKDWAFGETWGIAVDSRDHPWVLHSTNRRVRPCANCWPRKASASRLRSSSSTGRDAWSRPGVDRARATAGWKGSPGPARDLHRLQGQRLGHR